MPLDSGALQKIEGDTLEECQKKLFDLYGRDYHIENRESIVKPCGFLGLKTKAIQRVWYTVNHKSSYSSSAYQSSIEAAGQKSINESDELERKRDAILASQTATVLKSLANKVEEMNSKLSTMNTSISATSNELHPSIKQIEEILEQNEFTMSYIRMIEDKIRMQFSLSELDDFKLVERYVVDWIGESIKIAPEKVFRPPHVVVVIGPTGVGKTTTISKLAASTIKYAKVNKLKEPQLCIFTIDSMRVGAFEQLNTVAEIIHAPIRKAETTEDVQEIYDDYKEHVDYIFVDTGGYSPNDSTHIAMLKDVLDVKMNPDVYICVTASTKASDLQSIFNNYEPLNYDSVIITKCDETRVFGNIISVLWDRHKSISYITDGQNLAQNIRKASVTEMLMNLNGFNIDRQHIENKFGEK